jgi:hypothetical protein
MGRGEDFYDKRTARELNLEPEGSVAQVLMQSRWGYACTKLDYGTILNQTCQTL